MSIIESNWYWTKIIFNAIFDIRVLQGYGGVNNMNQQNENGTNKSVNSLAVFEIKINMSNDKKQK